MLFMEYGCLLDVIYFSVLFFWRFTVHTIFHLSVCLNYKLCKNYTLVLENNNNNFGNTVHVDCQLSCYL